jgi:signal transduction histidine kinase/ActR/RegA family two-component response regulator
MADSPTPAAPPGSLRHKVMVVVLSTTVVALMLSATALLIYELRSFQLSWLNDLQTQADIVGRVSAAALAFDDRADATASLALLGLRPQITAAAIYRADGDLFATYPASPAADANIPPRAGPVGHVIRNEMLELVQPIIENDKQLGTVYLRASYDINSRLLDYLAILVSVVLTSLFIAALVMGRLQRAITTPILDVAHVARSVMQSRNFALRASKSSDDEVGVLVDAFNDMLAEVGQRTDALERSNRHLSVEMTERRKAEEALRQAARTKDQFLATLAHELRNPLAPIRNAVEILRRTAASKDPALQQRALDIMARQVQQMVRLIDDLLDVSRITTGKLLLIKHNVDLLTVLHSAVEIAMPSIEARNHHLELALPEGPIWVQADATRVAQVFANLLNNAAKYTEPNGRIGLKVEAADGGWRVQVSDSGVGIAPDMLSSIFDMFVQVDQSLERGMAGLGVGLTLARQLVELHGGRIEVHSAGLGCGSEFSVWLPAQVAQAPLAVPPTPAADVATGAGHRILVADDNVDFATSLRSLLETLGHTVSVAHDGHTALALAAAVRPDFVFLDIGMPGLNGYELAQALREWPATRHSVLVAITGWGQQQDREKARACGIDHHLTKPVDVNQLMPILAATPVAA